MKQITEDYVSFEIAQLLKEKGFPQDYDRYHGLVYNEEDYEDEYEGQRMVLETRQVKAGTLHSYPLGVPEPKCYCPTQSIVLKWLREVYNIHIGTKPYNLQHPKLGKWYKTQTKATIYNTKDGSLLGDMLIKEEFREDTYEQALEAAINYVLKNLI